jgi:2-dehydropantoate 2-reductase
VKIAIWGAGAVGIGLASALARTGEELRILGREATTLQSLESLGLRRTGLFGERLIPPEQLIIGSDPTALVDDPPEWLLICTKAFATAEVANEMAPLASTLVGKTRLLLCQNGWGNEAPFLAYWPESQLFHARVITGFHRRQPHEVEITAHASPIALGSVFGTPISSLEDIARRITEGGIPAQTSEDMRAVLWAKMLYNCALNPIGALVGKRYGDLTENPATRALIEEVVIEIFQVLGAANISVPWPDAAAYLVTFYADLMPPTAQHESSMLQDLRAGRPTEIEALCGAVERLADRAGLETPVVSALASLVRAAERRPD